MQYRQAEGPWRNMAVVGFDGNRHYKDMPLDNSPGSADFKAAYDEARFQFYTGAAEGKPASEPVIDLSNTRQPRSGETYEGKFIARHEDKVIQEVTRGQETFHVAHDRTSLRLREQAQIKYGREVSIQYHTLGHASVRDRQPLQSGAASGKPGEAMAMAKPMDMPAIKAAEQGKTYDGKIVAFHHNQVIQAVSDGQKTIHIAHDRAALSSAKAGLLHQGKDLSIRYPFSGVGIVQERQLQHERKTPSHQPKGFGGKGF
ncbi:hypothetical protein [Pseudomonas sp. KCJK8751]